MKKNDVFKIRVPREDGMPGGREVPAIVLMKCSFETNYDLTIIGTFTWLCYAEHRLFTWKEVHSVVKDEIDLRDGTPGADSVDYYFGETIAEDVVLPEFDKVLKDYDYEKTV